MKYHHDSELYIRCSISLFIAYKIINTPKHKGARQVISLRFDASLYSAYNKRGPRNLYFNHAVYNENMEVVLGEHIESRVA